MPPELDVMLDADELERRWHDAGEYLKANGWVYDRHVKPPPMEALRVRLEA